MNTSKADSKPRAHIVMQRELKTQVITAENKETFQEESSGLKPCNLPASSSRFRSRSLRQSQPPQGILHGQELNSSKRRVQRKASLTGQEVKELADAFIARVHRSMRMQRQESLVVHFASMKRDRL